ncbi:MAG: hypothetical protein Q8P64_14930, partial [Deltaproteobacteria bacterium]|nr:hypothetical protein [Deltaproteobacteria bacterium]
MIARPDPFCDFLRDPFCDPFCGGRKSAAVIIILAAFIWLIYPTGIAQPQGQRGDVCEKRKGLVILVEFPDIVPPVD